MNHAERRGRVHWVGAGLSGRPGYERLARDVERPLVLWNRTVETARGWVAAAERPGNEAKTFSLEALRADVGPGDIVVSMLPASSHFALAEICLARGAHLVTTSYLASDMRSLDAAAKAHGLVILGECGLDPGLDHLFAHSLVGRMREKLCIGEIHEIDFESHCGGFPADPDEFRYRFSWSPVGVLRALKNPATWIEAGETLSTDRAYEKTRTISFKHETLEMYPNRDSTAYIQEYGFGELRDRVQTFVRGTLRPPGWRSAWQPVFRELTEPTRPIDVFAAELAREYAYHDGERDRVRMEVRLRVRDRYRNTRFDEFWSVDESADARRESAMARLVSIPAAIAVEEIERGGVAPGVQGPCGEDRGTGRGSASERAENLIERLKLAGLSLHHHAEPFRVSDA